MVKVALWMVVENSCTQVRDFDRFDKACVYSPLPVVQVSSLCVFAQDRQSTVYGGEQVAVPTDNLFSLKNF